MSDWKIKMDANGDFDLVQLDNLEMQSSEAKMEYEGGKVKEPEKPPYACRIGYHELQWYEGLMERYWFCKICDYKDRNKAPPKRKK